MKLLSGILICVAVIATWSYEGWMNVHFSNNCRGRLKRSADANTIEIAKQELGAAVSYLETNNSTSGYTSVIYNTPDEDVGFWYRNLKASLEELEKVPADAPPMDKTNTLMKLRETLLDHDGGKERVTCPEGMFRFPNNAFWGLVNVLSVIGEIVALFLISVGWEERKTAWR